MSARPKSPKIDKNEINRVYNNRHASICRQQSQQSNIETARVASISRTVSVEEETLMLGRVPSRKKSQEYGNILQNIELYGGNQINVKSDTAAFTPTTETSERWRTLSGTSRREPNSCTQTTNHAQLSPDANLDDVFIDELVVHQCYSSNATVHSPVYSSSSTASVIPQNPYNVWNHKVHDTMWCSFCLYFFLLCCVPAVMFMDKSDAVHRIMDDKKARKYGKVSTILYICGGILSLVLYGLLFFLAVYISTTLL